MKRAPMCLFLLLAFGHLVAAEDAKMATIRTVTGDDGIVLSGPHSEYMEYVLMDGTVLDPRIMTPARTE